MQTVSVVTKSYSMSCVCLQDAVLARSGPGREPEARRQVLGARLHQTAHQQHQALAEVLLHRRLPVVRRL